MDSDTEEDTNDTDDGDADDPETTNQTTDKEEAADSSPSMAELLELTQDDDQSSPSLSLFASSSDENASIQNADKDIPDETLEEESKNEIASHTCTHPRVATIRCLAALFKHDESAAAIPRW